MVSRHLLIPFIVLTVGCGQQSSSVKKKSGVRLQAMSSQLPIQSIIAKYNQLSEGSYDDISIDTASIQLLREREVPEASDFSCYRFIILNPAHYEYNLGHIKCLALVWQSDTNDIRLLLPENYAKSSVDFFQPYLNVSVLDKKDYCKKLSDLINYFTTFQTKEVRYDYLEEDSGIMVLSRSSVQSYDVATRRDITLVQTDSIRFAFSGDTLKSFSKFSHPG